MGLQGAIIGDIIGSRFEFAIPDSFNYKEVKLFNKESNFTDDTVLSVGTKRAIENGLSFDYVYRKITNEYPSRGYGGWFYSWVLNTSMQAYNSYGNGSAMRVPYIYDKFNTANEVEEWAVKSALVTHNHPEGVKGAVVTAMVGLMAKTQTPKSKIYEYLLSKYGDKYKYNLSIPLAEIRDIYVWSDICQETVPVAIKCFLDSKDYESAIRNVLSLPCDTDTMCCIAGGIAESFYGSTGFDNNKILSKYLPAQLLKEVKV